MSNPKYKVGQYIKCGCGCMSDFHKILKCFQEPTAPDPNRWYYEVGGWNIDETKAILLPGNRDFIARNAKNLPGVKINGR